MAPKEESSKASKSVTSDMAAAIAAAAAGAPSSSRGALGSEASTEQGAADSHASRRRNAEAFESSPDLTAANRRPDAWMSRARLVTKHAKKDTGGRFGRVMKAARPLAQVATPIVIAALGASYTCATGKQHDYQTAVQILNQREQSELVARSAVFDKPMSALLDKSNGIDARILTLETFLYNFHGIVNARNLLTDLENEIETSQPPDPQRSKRLQLIAQGVRHVQKQMLAAAMPAPISVDCGEKQASDSQHEFPSILNVAVKEERGCIIEYAGKWFVPRHRHEIRIVPLCVGKHKELESECPKLSPLIDGFSTSARIEMRVDERRFEPFELTKFGSPFSDNTIIDDGHRIALLLRSVSADKVELEVVAFPEDLVPPGYQPTITNISRLLSGESG